MTTVTHLTDGGSTTNGTSFDTAAITPAANKLYLLTVDYTPVSGVVAPTVTGGGLGTWTEIGGGEYGGAGAGRVIRMFRALSGSPGSAAAVNLSFPVNAQSLDWSIEEVDGVDTSGTNGSGAIVQAVANLPSSSGTNLLVTLAAFGSTNNVAYGGFSHGANETSTVGSGYTALANRSIGTPSLSLLTEHQLNDTTVDASWATSTTRGAIAVEIKAAAAAASLVVPPRPMRGLTPRGR